MTTLTHPRPLRHPVRLLMRPLAAALAVAAGAVLAQAAGPVLKGSQVTADALVDALAVDPPPAADGQPPSRGIRPSLVQTNPALKPKPAGPGKASLLITFATGSADLTPEGIQVLDTVARALQSDRLAAFSFRVEGHADPRGGSDLNQKLSAERAEAVVAYLAGKHGIAADRLAPVGKGATELMNPGKPDAPENRRVTIVTVR